MQQQLFWRFDRSFKQLLSFVLMFCISVIVVSCTANAPDQAQSTKPIVAPATHAVRLAMIPVRNVNEQTQKLKSFQDYLQQVLNRPVDIQMTKNYDAAVDLLVNEKVEMAYLGALTYIKAHEKNPNIEPLVFPIDQASGRPWYTGAIVANTEQNIRLIADLKGKRFAFVSPSSTSGFLMPMNAFQKEGIQPEQDFTAIRYAGSHDNAIAALAAGQVDAMATETALFEKAQQSGKLSAKYKMIWESDPIPNTPIVINTQKFSPETITRLRQALIDAPSGIVNVSGISSDGHTLAKDADFEQTRQIYNRLKAVTVAEK